MNNSIENDDLNRQYNQYNENQGNFKTLKKHFLIFISKNQLLKEKVFRKHNCDLDWRDLYSKEFFYSREPWLPCINELKILCSLRKRF